MEAEFRLPSSYSLMSAICPYTRDGQHFIDIIQDYDSSVLAQWGRGSSSQLPGILF
jgi:hypothetical protein